LGEAGNHSWIICPWLMQRLIPADAKHRERIEEAMPMASSISGAGCLRGRPIGSGSKNPSISTHSESLTLLRYV
ncbi:MAG TPA: hypothetical protein PL166_13860, partial [Candidatus Contendobacter sp.]|nr:hypothetical protein [Candidatus Contendobacter sp.]HRD50663.1 hypothetical protein [Candidatus Contendobacter sp.]